MPRINFKSSVIMLLLVTTGCAATETNVDWLSNSQKIDEDRKAATPKTASAP